MALLRNPELIRNARMQLRTRKVLAVAAICAVLSFSGRLFLLFTIGCDARKQRPLGHGAVANRNRRAGFDSRSRRQHRMPYQHL